MVKKKFPRSEREASFDKRQEITGVKGSARHGWEVDLAPTGPQHCPNGGVVSTPLPYLTWIKTNRRM